MCGPPAAAGRAPPAPAARAAAARPWQTSWGGRCAPQSCAARPRPARRAGGREAPRLHGRAGQGKRCQQHPPSNQHLPDFFVFLAETPPPNSSNSPNPQSTAPEGTHLVVRTAGSTARWRRRRGRGRHFRAVLWPCLLLLLLVGCGRRSWLLFLGVFQSLQVGDRRLRRRGGSGGSSCRGCDGGLGSRCRLCMRSGLRARGGAARSGRRRAPAPAGSTGGPAQPTCCLPSARCLVPRRLRLWLPLRRPLGSRQRVKEPHCGPTAAQV